MRGNSVSMQPVCQSSSRVQPGMLDTRLGRQCIHPQVCVASGPVWERANGKARLAARVFQVTRLQE